MTYRITLDSQQMQMLLSSLDDAALYNDERAELIDGTADADTMKHYIDAAEQAKEIYKLIAAQKEQLDDILIV